MTVHKIRTRAHIAGAVTIGANADAGLERAAANVIGPKTGDTLAGPPAVNGSPAVIGPAARGGVAGALVVRANPAGTPCLAFRHSNGTVYSLYFAPAGGAGTGTPVAS